MAKAIARETHTPVVMTTHTDFEYFNFGRFGRREPGGIRTRQGKSFP